MEITYRCGDNDDQVITVPGDAWDHPPAQLVCNGSTIATNHQDVTPPTQGTAAEPACKEIKLEQPESDYFIAPRAMLDWTPTEIGRASCRERRSVVGAVPRSEKE